MTRTKIIAIAVGLALAAGVAFFLVGRSGPRGGEAGFLGGLLAGVDQPDEVGLPDGSPTSDAGLVAEAERYQDPTHGFFFDYPEGFIVTSFQEGDGEVVLAEGGGAGDGFQIFIAPFDESGPVTAERIRQDLPLMAIHEPQRAAVGGADALVFFSEDPSLGKLREVWFSHGGYLYQITAPAAFDEELSKIMATFKFSE